MPLIVEIAYVVEAEERATPGIFGGKCASAQAYGLLIEMWCAGTIVGPLRSECVKAEAGWGTMACSLGALGGISIVLTLLWIGGLLHRPGGRREQGEVTV